MFEKDCTTYVALDVHKKSHAVAMVVGTSDHVEPWTVANEPEAIRRMVRRIKAVACGPIQFCYEAGVCGFALARRFIGEGTRCMVVAPSLIPRKPGERVKTDRRDASKLVHLLRAGMLTSVFIPTEAEESVRELCRYRQAAQTDLTRSRHRLVKFLLRRGRIYTTSGHWTVKHWRWLGSLRFPQRLDQMVFTQMFWQVQQRAEHLQVLDKELVAVASEPLYREPVGWLRCFKGIETVTALTLVAELYAVGRFDSARSLMNYVGLTPTEQSSGLRRRGGGISKTGNRRVRRLLIEASWNQCRSRATGVALRRRRVGQPASVVATAQKAQRRLYRRYWHLVHAGKAPAKAVAAIARELVGFLWSVLLEIDARLSESPA